MGISPKLLIRFNFSFLLCVLFFTFYVINNNIIIDNDELEEKDNKKARDEWMLQMLADPNTGKVPNGIRSKEMMYLQYLLQEESMYKRERNEAVWNVRGPWNVGGRTRSMAIDILNENHLIAGAVSGGIWQSMDAGATWQKVSEANAHPGIVSITQDKRPGREHIWYALSGEIYGTSASGGSAFYLGDGAFISLDNGNTWSSIASTAIGKPNQFQYNFQGGWRIVSSPVDTVATCIYMANYGTVYRSTDTGNTWYPMLNAGNSSYFTDVDVDSKGIVYMALSSGGAAKGFYRSANGVSVTNITPPQLKSFDRTVIGINPNNENEVYFLSELPSDTSGGVKTTNYEGTPEYVSLFKYTYISGDGSGNGGKWENLSPNLPISSENQFDKFNCQGGYDLCVRIQPITNYVYIGGTNLYRSTDGFTSPNNTTQIGGYGLATQLANFTSYPNHHPDLHDIYFLKSNSKKAYTVSDGGVHFSNDITAPNVEWIEKSHGYISSQCYTVDIDETKPYDQFLLSGFQDNANYVTYTNKMNAIWKMTINGDGSYNFVAPNKKYFLISTQQGNVRKVLLDERGNVIRRKRIDPDSINKNVYNFIHPIAVDTKEGHTLYLPIGKKVAFYKNIDKLPVENNSSKLKTGWTFINDTIKTSNIGTTTAKITSIAISNSFPNIVYLGTNNKEIFRIVNPKSANDSLKRCSTTRLPIAGSYVSDIAVDPDSSHVVFVCYSNYGINSMYYSSDTGNTWYYVGGNLDAIDSITGAAPSIRSVAILKDANGKRRYFAGTSIGLFSTDSLIYATSNANNKTIWKQESSNHIGAAIVTDIKTRNSDGYVVAATHGNGIFDAYYFTNKSPVSLPQSDYAEIYPNPASNHINYTFIQNEEGEVYAEIYNILGRKVKVTINEFFRKGTFTIKLNVTDLQPGHYFVALYSSNKKPLVKHFIIAR